MGGFQWWTVMAGRCPYHVGGWYVKLGPVTVCWGRWFGRLRIEVHAMNRLVLRCIP